MRRAHATHPVADLQIEYSLLSRGIEAEILPACRSLGIGVTAYGVLSRGLLSWPLVRRARPGRRRLPRLGAPLHWPQPRPQPGPGRGAALVADAKGATVAQLAIGWVLSRGPDIVPLVGARRRDLQLAEALGALSLELTGDDLAAIERAVPAGPPPVTATMQMATLDSERPGTAAG